MFEYFSFRKLRRQLIYSFVAATVAIALSSIPFQPSYANSWLDLIFQGVQIIQISNLSDSQEVKIGQQIDGQLVKSGQVKLSNNPKLNSYLDRLGQRLVKSSDRANIPYTFQVVNDKSINAFATMGGFVYINTGLMAEADNEAELASVVAHEIGHIVARHSVKQMRQAAISQGLLSAAGLDESTIVKLGVQLAVNLPNSREDELEADRLGLTNLQRAGYAPSAMVAFLEKLLKKGGSVPSFLSTHPATSDRIANLKQSIDAETANEGDGLDSRAYRSQVSSAL